MLLRVILKVALASLAANKLRSFLATLGIIIGVGAVISMLALGAGARQDILGRVTALGTNLLILRPGQRGTGGVMSGTQQNLTLEDAEAIAHEVPGVDRVAPVVSGQAQVKRGNRNSRVMVQGVTRSYLDLRGFEIERGRAFTADEADGLARVAILGPVTATNLFGEGDPTGETVKLNGLNFTVIGVTKAKGDQGWFNPDDQAMIPVGAAMKTVFGVDRLREIDVRAADEKAIPQLEEAVRQLVRRRHRIEPGAPDDFEIRNQAEMLAMFAGMASTLTLLLGGIAGISLLVGGIGIMNIMLVTVTERTREIGVRKAIGARDRDILRQFLIESGLMSGLGGLAGIGLGIGVARLFTELGGFTTLVETRSVLLSFGVAAAVGIFFGYYPARRAAGLDPIEALRHE